MVTGSSMGYAQARTMSNSAVVYARVSSKDQEREGFSIPAQLDLLRLYSAGRGFRIAHEFVDVETAKQAGRAAFAPRPRGPRRDVAMGPIGRFEKPV